MVIIAIILHSLISQAVTAEDGRDRETEKDLHEKVIAKKLALKLVIYQEKLLKAQRQNNFWS